MLIYNEYIFERYLFMYSEIAIITTPFLYDFIVDTIKEIDTELKYKMFTYYSFETLPELYNSIPPNIKGVITTGFFPRQIIRRHFPNTTRIINAVNSDHSEILKLLLQMLYKNRELDFSRIYSDMLDIVGIDTKEYVLDIPSLTYNDMLECRIAEMTNDELVNSENAVLEKHLALWKAEKIDFSITRFSGIIPRLKEEGIPVYFPFFTKNNLKEVIQTTLNEMKIIELSANQIAAITISLKDRAKRLSDENAQPLYQNIKKYIKINNLDCILNYKQSGIEIITNSETIRTITNNFKTSELEDFLKKRLSFDIAIGYGIGNNMHIARINAMDANCEAAQLTKSSSCLINEKSQQIILDGNIDKLVISRVVSKSIQEASKKTKLSYLSLQKLRAVANSVQNSPITSQELAFKLSVTQRTANRFLNALLKAGLCEIVEKRKGTTRGRPERVYQFKLDKI